MAEENSKNHLTRVGEDFYNWVVGINKERDSLGRKKLSIRFLTNHLIKHNSSPIMREDFVNLNLKELKCKIKVNQNE